MKCSNRTIGYANKMGHLVQNSCSLYANNKNTGQIAHQRVFINDIVMYCLERINASHALFEIAGLKLISVAYLVHNSGT